MIRFFVKFIVFVCLVSNPLAACEDDQSASLVEAVLMARSQIGSVEGKIEFTQLDGNLQDMPRTVRYDVKSDEIANRYWIRRQPIGPLPKYDDELRNLRILTNWGESYSMRREGVTYQAFDPSRLSLHRNPLNLGQGKGFTIYTLGFQTHPQAEWTPEALDKAKGILGIGVPGVFQFNGDVQINETQVKIVEFTSEFKSVTRRMWIDPVSLRLHRFEIPCGLFDYELRPEDRAHIVITSEFDQDNLTVIPNSVLVEETVNGEVRRKFRFDLSLEPSKVFTDNDFAFTEMGLKINAMVWDLDTRQFNGYWNGRDWLSKSPIGGTMVAVGILEDASKTNTRKGFGAWGYSGIVLMIIAGILVCVVCVRRSIVTQG